MIPGVILGIDPSLTGTGWCLVADSAVEGTGCVSTQPEQPRPQRLDAIRGALRRVLAHYPREPFLVAMEAEIWLGKGGFQATDQSAVQAILQDAFWTMDPRPEFLSVNVSHVKKYVGAQQKSQILLKVYKTFKREFDNDNIADAFVVAQIADAFVHYRDGKLFPDVTKTQIEVLDKLLKQPPSWEALKRAKEKIKKQKEKRE